MYMTLSDPGGKDSRKLTEAPHRCSCHKEHRQSLHTWSLSTTWPERGESDPILAQLAALKTAPIGALKQKWRDLFEHEPPPYNRRFLEHRLAYRIQELAYGGLRTETVARLRKLAEQFDGGDPKRRRQPAKDRPISGTRLIREFQGVEHCVTVRDEGYEYQGRPYKSLSAIARAITGTRWNGLVFFGLKNQRVAR
jgi:hypothetical protein